jgi:hypothetical protein
LYIGGNAYVLSTLTHAGSAAGFFNATPTTQPTVVGARNDPEDALANLLAALNTLGLIVDSTTAT